MRAKLRAARYAAANEHLKQFIDQVLEAFQNGTGIINNAPEPITLDVARRIIWAELQHVFTTLDTAVDWSRFLWIRATHEDGLPELVKVFDHTPGVEGCSFRAFGARRPGDQTVVYACLHLAKNAKASEVLDYVWKVGVATRDVVLGSSVG